MFKRGLALLLATIFGVASTDIAMAVEYETYTEQGTYGSDVTMNIASSYMVSIPKKIDLDTSGEKATSDYIVGVKGTIEEGTSVKVVPDETFDMTSTFGNVVSATTEQVKVEFLSDELNPDTFLEENGTVTADKKIGEYKGVLNFNIDLVETTKVELKDASEAIKTKYGFKTITSSNVSVINHGGLSVWLSGADSSTKVVYVDRNIVVSNGGMSYGSIEAGYYIITNGTSSMNIGSIVDNIFQLNDNMKFVGSTYKVPAV